MIGELPSLQGAETLVRSSRVSPGGDRGDGEAFMVAGEAVGPADPGGGALHHPAAGQDVDAARLAGDDGGGGAEVGPSALAAAAAARSTPAPHSPHQHESQNPHLEQSVSAPAVTPSPSPTTAPTGAP